ncbi:xanthine dehydrogenase subunit D [Bacillus massiliglaciei]|uniref:xanthine dehydrogenase subunit D n=1 Tax=Bacillus massiliglaciei TaxID=1816693 RepID=UPI000AD7C61F|nr:xanthine dehydrogenase subunit D [Bacillus massiliglaciei]
MVFNIGERKDRTRPDGQQKVTGSLHYLTDLSFEGMLHGKILRSPYPHARITGIHIEEAEKLPGVAAVITSKDVPGLNRFGIVFPDQPVLCEERVRYTGDAVAAVAAETETIALKALELIKVEYEELPVLDTPEKALRPDAIKLHPDGNILHKASYHKGNLQDGFSQCVQIVEETYELPRQMHAYMETEGGVFCPEPDGTITVYAGTQHGFKDRFQLSRILAVPEEEIRIVSSPMGGSFGGKDELNIQPCGVLLARKANRPVKIHHTRKESLKAGLKRHPMKIRMKTGADAGGKIQAHEAEIIADTGAYATLGPAILDFAVEHASGPYIIPNAGIEGVSVFTNNGVSGEFRGFGGNQVTFALEGQIDRLAEALKLDPAELRRRNIRGTHDRGPLGHRIVPTNGARDVLEEIIQLDQKRRTERKQPEQWKRKGTGIAITMHGGGLGHGRMDPAGGRLSLTKEGKIEAGFGFEECGQGLVAVIENIVSEEMGCLPEEVSILIGDTAAVPVSGSSTASRGTAMVWHSVQKMKQPFSQLLSRKAGELLGIDPDRLCTGKGGLWDRISAQQVITYKELGQHSTDRISVQTGFDFPVTPDPVAGGHYLYSFGSVRVAVEVDMLTGQVKVTDIDQVIAAGPVISPNGYRGQIEGGAVMSLGYTLMEHAVMENSVYQTENFDSYLIPSIADVPFHSNVWAVEDLCEGDHYGPRGIGEIGTIAIIPAIVKAIHDATGIWVQSLPVSPEVLLDQLNEKGVLSWT